MTHDAPYLVAKRLEDIEKDLAHRQNDYEKAAGDRARLIRDWARKEALARGKAKGPDADARKAAAFVIAAEQDDTYEELSRVEGEYAALHAVVRVLETRATIAQSILRSQGRS